MDQHQRQQFRDLLEVQSSPRRTDAMLGYMAGRLASFGCRVEVRPGTGIIARKGPTGLRPFYVAHADTVHQIVPPDHYRVQMWDDKEEGPTWGAYDPHDWGPRGVGGDDKCGLWVCLEAARTLKTVGILITIDEEIGCIGASRVRLDDLADATVLIEADRRGNSDAVTEIFGTISSEAWQDHVNEIILAHGYAWTRHGVITDVGTLVGDHIAGVSAVNLSAGYHSPHTMREYIVERELDNCVALALALGRASAERRWPHTPTYPTHRQYGRWEDDWNDGFWDDYDRKQRIAASPEDEENLARIEREERHQNIIEMSDDDFLLMTGYIGAEAASELCERYVDGEEVMTFDIYGQLQDFEGYIEDGEWRDIEEPENPNEGALYRAGQYSKIPCAVSGCDEASFTLDNTRQMFLCKAHYHEVILESPAFTEGVVQCG